MKKINDFNIKAQIEFFKDDVLDFRNYPVEEIANEFQKAQKKYYFIDTTIIKSDVKRKEYKDYLYCIFVNNIFDWNSDKTHYVFNLCEYLSTCSFETVMDYDSVKHEKELLEYFHSKGLLYDTVILPIIKLMKITLIEFYDNRKGLERDVWNIKDLNISKERINLSCATSTLNFRRIENVHNRELVKMYFKNLLGNTETTFATMNNYLTQISTFCYFLENKPLEEVEHTDFESFIISLGQISANKHNKLVNSISDFFKYLAVKEVYNKKAPIQKSDFRREGRKHHDNCVSEYVILQIFRNLYQLPNDLLLMYLINYTTGMRASDICQLKTDCLIKEESTYFIRFYIQKLQKDHAVLICPALGELIEKRINALSKLDYDETYLFYRKENTPRTTAWYMQNMKRYCTEWNIKNEDNTPYNFQSHSYRHTIASDLINNYNVPLEIVQLSVLGHANIQMTLAYIDITDEQSKMQNDKYIDNAGGFTSLESSDLMQPDFVKENIKKQILPNGLCSFPTMLGTCPNSDTCLSCEHFRTSKRFLNIHKEHFKRLEKEIIQYESDGLINNLETAKLQMQILKKIIETLEEQEE